MRYIHEWTSVRKAYTVAGDRPYRNHTRWARDCRLYVHRTETLSLQTFIYHHSLPNTTLTT